MTGRYMPPISVKSVACHTFKTEAILWESKVHVVTEIEEFLNNLLVMERAKSTHWLLKPNTLHV